jgi:asparagine synthase (glutamine-hydrolysing)
MNNADIEWTCLRSPLLRYPEPFSDYSLLSSYSLASAVINRYDSNCNILDGTGADGLFGLFDKATNWRKLLILPRIIFFMASIAYEISGCSMRPGWLEERLRPLRRAWQLPYPAAALAQNPHNGIFYSSPAETTRHVCESLMTWCSNILQSADRHLVLPLMDVALICCNVFVPKMKHHFNRACFPVLYPFLDSRVVDFALHDVHPSEERESKGLLKKLLGRMVPHSMVYRPKSGFIPPLRERFAHPEMLERVAALAEESSPMRAYVNFGALQQAITALGQKRALPSQTYNSLWGLIFLDAWLRDAESIPVPRARHC